MQKGDLVRVLDQDVWYGYPEISGRTGVVMGMCEEHEGCIHIIIEKRVYAIPEQELQLLNSVNTGEDND